MAKQTRELKVAAAKGYTTRTETFEEREYLVVPVVALVEGVVHAMNAETPEFVSAEEFSRAPGGWNNRPLYHGHPIVSGHPVSGNTPDVLEALCIGRVFNAKVKGKKLVMEAWIDVLKAEDKAPELLQRVKDDDSIEISVGVFVETDEEKGTFDGKKFMGAWHDIVPDHLALLQKGDEGACSVDMGCGVRAAQKNEANVADEKKTERKPSLLSKFLQMFRAAQPAEQMSDNDLRQRLSAALRAKGLGNVNYVEAFYPVTNPNRVVYSVYVPAVETGMGYPMTGYELHERSFVLDANGVVTLADSYVEVEPVLSYEPVLMAEEAEAEPTAAKGARNSKADQQKIQMMHDHAMALGANCDPKTAAAPKAASGAQCSCGNHGAPTNNATTEGERAMAKTKDEMKAFVDGASDEQLKALSAVAEAKPTEAVAPAAPAAVVPVATPAVAAVATPAVEEKPTTLADLMAKATPEVKAQYEANIKAASDKKTATIKALKDTGRCPMTDAQLQGKEQEELDQLVALAGSPKVDFGGQGAPKDLGSNKGDVPAPTDLNERIRAARAARK